MFRRAGALAAVVALVFSGCAAEAEPTVAPDAVNQSVSTQTAQPTTPAEVSAIGAPLVAAVDHVGLAVTDLPASTAFFVEGLGFAVRGKDPSYPAVFLSNGHALVTLWGIADAESATPFDRKRNVGLHHLALSVTSFEALDELHTSLARMPGVRVEFAPELSYGGPAKHMMVFEPSGNRIELVHRPPAS